MSREDDQRKHALGWDDQRQVRTEEDMQDEKTLSRQEDLCLRNDSNQMSMQFKEKNNVSNAFDDKTWWATLHPLLWHFFLVRILKPSSLFLVLGEDLFLWNSPSVQDLLLCMSVRYVSHSFFRGFFAWCLSFKKTFLSALFHLRHILKSVLFHRSTWLSLPHLFSNYKKLLIILGIHPSFRCTSA